jgi:hypothetical protein
MTILGKHCKAFPLSRLRQFPGWTEKSENARTIKREVDGETVEEPRQLSDADYVYLQRNFTVTDGIFIDENIIFSDITAEWVDYCRTALGLENHGRDSEQHSEDNGLEESSLVSQTDVLK